MLKGKLQNLSGRIADRKTLAFVISGLLLCVNIALTIFILSPQHSKIGYVNTGVLYSKFKMKQEMEHKIQGIAKVQENNLYAYMDTLRNALGSDTMQQMERYREKAGKITEQQQSIAAKYNEQIWKQLNQYVKEYTELHHFDMMLGANGTGNVMAADSALDETQMIIAYANKRYEGSSTVSHDN